MNMVWHYTPWSYLPKIVDSGHLRPANAGAPTERPLLWFSSRKDFEPTALKAFQSNDGRPQQLTFEEQVSLVGCVRFGLPQGDTRLMPWVVACKEGGISITQKRVMEKRGKQIKSSSGNWFATSISVPLEEMEFHVFINGKWMPADDLRGMADVGKENYRT